MWLFLQKLSWLPLAVVSVAYHKEKFRDTVKESAYMCDICAAVQVIP